MPGSSPCQGRALPQGRHFKCFCHIFKGFLGSVIFEFSIQSMMYMIRTVSQYPCICYFHIHFHLIFTVEVNECMSNLKKWSLRLQYMIIKQSEYNYQSKIDQKYHQNIFFMLNTMLLFIVLYSDYDKHSKCNVLERLNMVVKPKYISKETYFSKILILIFCHTYQELELHSSQNR